MPHLVELGPAGRQINVKGRLKGWPGAGALDIEIGGPSSPTWIELKWAKQAGTLFNCLWDAGKLAQAIREGQASYGYLVAGAPGAEWEKTTPYRELFSVSCHRDQELVTEHVKEWRRWWRENQNTFPIEMPAPVITVPVGRVAFDSATGQPWQIKVARVEVPGAATYSPRDLV